MIIIAIGGQWPSRKYNGGPPKTVETTITSTVERREQRVGLHWQEEEEVAEDLRHPVLVRPSPRLRYPHQDTAPPLAHLNNVQHNQSANHITVPLSRPITSQSDHSANQTKTTNHIDATSH